MKYQILNLLENEHVACHEVRASTFGNSHVLLHFFITQQEDSLPVFQLGYERYAATTDDLEEDKITMEMDNLRHFALVQTMDTQSNIFSDNVSPPIRGQRNEWTGEQAPILNRDLNDLSVSPNSYDNINVNKNLRHVSEMADNAIYDGDEVLSGRTYLNEKDSSLRTAAPMTNTTNEEIIKNENKTSHSIWTSNIHLNKFEKCSNEELFELFKKYKSYIGVSIPKDLDTESRLSIDMVSIFGASFDVTRIKNNMFTKEDEYTV